MKENNRLSKKNTFHLDAFISFEREIRTKDSLHDFFKVEDVIGKIEILLIFGSKIVEFNNYLFRYSWYNFITKHLITIVHLYERAHCMGSNLCVFHVLLHVYDIWKDLFALYSYRLESFINLYIYINICMCIYMILWIYITMYHSHILQNISF